MVVHCAHCTQPYTVYIVWCMDSRYRYDVPYILACHAMMGTHTIFEYDYSNEVRTTALIYTFKHAHTRTAHVHVQIVCFLVFFFRCRIVLILLLLLVHLIAAAVPFGGIFKLTSFQCEISASLIQGTWYKLCEHVWCVCECTKDRLLAKQLSVDCCFRASLLGVYSALLDYVRPKMMRANFRNLNMFWVSVCKGTAAGRTDPVPERLGAFPFSGRPFNEILSCFSCLVCHCLFSLKGMGANLLDYGSAHGQHRL